MKKGKKESFYYEEAKYKLENTWPISGKIREAERTKIGIKGRVPKTDGPEEGVPKTVEASNDIFKDTFIP